MMSFISYESYMQKAKQEPGMTIDKLMNIGDIVDVNIINKHIADMPPLCCGEGLVQFGEQYSLARNDEGRVEPCYITFAFEDNDWVFKGACFEGAVDNRCNLFERANPTVGEYCLDKFYSEYVRAADRMLMDKAKGMNVDNSSIIDDYMQLNAFTLTGYWLDVHHDDALESFVEAWAEYQEDRLYKPTLNLIVRKDVPFDSVVFNKQPKEQRQGINNVNALIADAKTRSAALGSVSSGKDVQEISM